ncbi:MAG: glycoside hydrolase 100 family protein [Patescibacteria group bacterium]
MKNELIKQCYQKSIELLMKNSSSDGFLAATPKGRATMPSIHYDWVYGRDSSICSIGAIMTGNKELLRIAKRTLLLLARYQTKYGQIPNALSEKQKKVEYYFLSSLDATLWWLVAIKYYHQHSPDKKTFKLLEPRIKKAIRWLNYQTGGETNLLVQGQGSDWADIMPYSGHALYSNVLWYWVQKLYNLKIGARLTESGINNLFYPFPSKANALFYKNNFMYRLQREYLIKKIKPTSYYLSHISIYSAGQHCDVYSNILAILLGLPDIKLKSKIYNYFVKNKVNKPYPVKVLTPPIFKNDKEWQEIMERHELNLPWQYHNGGIWPYVGGFWVMMLKNLGQRKLAISELVRLAEANKVKNWQFNEWFNGRTGKPMGMPGQSWNAGTFILAYHYLKGDFKI